MTLITKTFTIRDNFPRGFYEALGAYAVAFGRVEYAIKLAVKSLSGKDFVEGMEEAGSTGTFNKLCNRAKTLASNKLRDPQLSQFTSLIDEALALASERNNNLHAFWTAESENTARRICLYLNWDTKRLEPRNRSVTDEELNDYVNRLRGLFNSIEMARKSW